MPQTHVVKQGETMVALAEQYGFFARSLWEHPLNAGLRERRKRMDVLYPGDEVKIPDPEPKSASFGTGRTHRFKRKGVPAMFRLVLRRNGKPRAGVAWRLEIDGKVITGETGEDGLIEQHVRARASTGALYLDGAPEPITLRFGHMDPLSTVDGVRKRLRNLGYAPPDDDDTAAKPWRKVLKAFQRAEGLPVNGTLDDKTREAVGAAHDKKPEGGEG